MGLPLGLRTAMREDARDAIVELLRGLIWINAFACMLRNQLYWRLEDQGLWVQLSTQHHSLAYYA
jgi:hypothetical protein